MPTITDVSDYGNKWVAWWSAMQPKSRHGGTGDLSRDGNHNFDDVVLRGPNGFLNIIKSLFWWREAVKSDSDMVEWQGAVSDVLWVLKAHTCHST